MQEISASRQWRAGVASLGSHDSVRPGGFQGCRLKRGIAAEFRMWKAKPAQPAQPPGPSDGGDDLRGYEAPGALEKEGRLRWAVNLR